MNGFERRKQIKKTAILHTALDLFMGFGVQKVSVAEIAEKAAVSQVTIYNYFGSKENLVHEVILFYIEKEWKKFDQLLKSKLTFHEKVQQIIFNKKEAATKIHEDFYDQFMKDYAPVEKFYQEKLLPRLTAFFEEGKVQGYIDPAISTEAIILFIQMMKQYVEQVNPHAEILPFTEDLTKLLFYGIAGTGRAE